VTDDPNELPAMLEALGDAQPKYFTKPTPGAKHDPAAARIVAHLSARRCTRGRR